MRQLIATTLFFAIMATNSPAEDAKFKVEGGTLFYNTDIPDLDKDYITYSDTESFRIFLGENPDI